MNDIFNILIVIGGSLIIIGVFYTFFWNNKASIEKKKENDTFKSVNNLSILKIKGDSYSPNLKIGEELPVSSDEIKHEEIKPNVVQPIEKNEYDKAIEQYEGEDDFNPFAAFETGDNEIDPEENLKKYAAFNEADFEKAKELIFEENENEENENEKEDTSEDKIIENEKNQEIDPSSLKNILPSDMSFEDLD